MRSVPRWKGSVWTVTVPPAGRRTRPATTDRTSRRAMRAALALWPAPPRAALWPPLFTMHQAPSAFGQGLPGWSPRALRVRGVLLSGGDPHGAGAAQMVVLVSILLTGFRILEVAPDWTGRPACRGVRRVRGRAAAAVAGGAHSRSRAPASGGWSPPNRRWWPGCCRTACAAAGSVCSASCKPGRRARLGRLGLLWMLVSPAVAFGCAAAWWCSPCSLRAWSGRHSFYPDRGTLNAGDEARLNSPADSVGARPTGVFGLVAWPARPAGASRPGNGRRVGGVGPATQQRRRWAR
jgi:hypothetical protein